MVDNLQGELKVIMVHIFNIDLFDQWGNSTESLYYNNAILLFADELSFVMIFVVSACYSFIVYS